MSEKVEYANVKIGQFFCRRRCLYQKTEYNDAIRIRGKRAGEIVYPEDREKVTIVKIKILEI